MRVNVKVFKYCFLLIVIVINIFASSDVNTDIDNDGISNKDEIVLGSDPQSSTYYDNFFQISSDDKSVYTDFGLTVMVQGEIGDKFDFSFDISNVKDGLTLVGVESSDEFLQCKLFQDNNIKCQYIINNKQNDDSKYIYTIFKVGDNKVKIPIQTYLNVKIITKPIGEISINSLPMAIALKDNIAYIGSFDDAQIKLYDISDLTNIKYIKSFKIGEATITDIFIDNQKMYVSLGSEGVAIIDVTDAKNPKILKTRETGREYWDIFGQSLSDGDYGIGKEYVYAIDSKQGILDIFDSNLNIVKSIDIGASKLPSRVYVSTLIWSSNLSVKGRYIFISNPDKGLNIYHSDKDFKNIKKIYTNSEFSPSDVRGVDDVLNIEINSKQKHINGISSLYQFIVYGTKTYYLYLSDDKVSNIQKIYNYDTYDKEAINTFGSVDNRYEGIWSGEYTYKTIDKQNFTQKEKIITNCNGEIVSKNNYLMCANANSKKLEIYPTKSTGSYLTVNKGWSLVSLPVDSEIKVNTFSNSKILWKYNNGKWEGWSPSANYQSKLQNYQNKGIIKIFDSIKPAEGFWIYSDKTNIKKFSGNKYGIEKLNIAKGWNLVGVGKDISLDDLKDFNVSLIWIYEDGNWKVWGKDLPSNFYENYKRIDKINTSQGFWILIK